MEKEASSGISGRVGARLRMIRVWIDMNLQEISCENSLQKINQPKPSLLMTIVSKY